MVTLGLDLRVPLYKLSKPALSYLVLLLLNLKDLIYKLLDLYIYKRKAKGLLRSNLGG